MDLVERHRISYLHQIALHSKKKNVIMVNDKKVNDLQKLQESIQSPWIVNSPGFRSHKVGTKIAEYF